MLSTGLSSDHRTLILSRLGGRVFAALLVPALAAGTLAAASPTGYMTAATSGGTWGKAEEVPGTAALNLQGAAGVNSVSCPSAGNCSAGGFYGNGGLQGFVVSQKNGIWGTAEEVPGLAALNQGRAFVTSVSCASAGNCGAGGLYASATGGYAAFVVSQRRGVWHTAVQIPGLAALNQGGDATVNAVSCPSAGNCAVAGFYSDSSYNQQAFIDAETDGAWGTAQEVPGTAALNQGGLATAQTVSCASAGNCALGGYYTAGLLGDQQAFIATETNGAWGTAQEVPGTATLNKGHKATVSSVSCATPGDCSAGGSYTASGHSEVFVVNETNGTWGTAQEVPGTATLNAGRNAIMDSVSCASAGNCSAGGGYGAHDVYMSGQAFVADETNGTWGAAQEVPGTAALNKNGDAVTVAVSCASAGNCSASGDYTSGSREPFVVSETNGIWGTAHRVPGLALPGHHAAEITSLSCASAGNCSTGGDYYDPSGNDQAWVADKASGS